MHLVNITNKLKAGLSAIIQNDDHLINRSKEIYMNNTTIYADSDEELKYLNPNKFYEFLEQDNRIESCSIDLNKFIRK